MRDKKIVPGKRIGVFKLGMEYEEVIHLLKEDYEEEERTNSYAIWTEKMGYFFDNDIKPLSIKYAF